MKNLIITIIYAFLCFQINCCCLGSRTVDSNFGLNHERISDVQAFEQAVRNHDFYNICLHRSKKPNDSERVENSFCQLDRPLIDEIFNDIHEEILDQRRKNPDQYIFVLFSECFFGENEPLNNDDVGYIIEKCRLLSQEKRVMLQVSMLHKFNTNDSPYWLKGKYKPLKSKKEIAKRITKVGKNNEYISLVACAKNFLIADKDHSDRVASYTLTIIDGKIVEIYRKSTYCEEADKYVHTTYNTAKCAFEFGDFCAHLAEDSPFAKFFIGKNSLIATRMCSDMNEPRLNSDSSTKLVLVHANGHPLRDYSGFHKFIFFIDDQGIALLFANGMETGISWKNFREMNSCIRGHFDLSLLNFSVTPYSFIRLDCVQYEIN